MAFVNPISTSLRYVSRPTICSLSFAGRNITVSNRISTNARIFAVTTTPGTQGTSTECEDNLQSPINVPLIGTIVQDASQAPLITEGSKVKLLAEFEEANKNFHMEVEAYRTMPTITVGSITYKLAQLHMHTPSENHVNDIEYPMEMHLVHANEEDATKRVVLAILFETSDDDDKKNEEFDKVLEAMKEANDELNEDEGEESDDDDDNDGEDGEAIYVNIQNMIREALVPAEMATFMGSLTTPNASGIFETDIQWVVSKAIATISKDQLEEFQEILSSLGVTRNDRALQDICDREIITFK